MRTTKNTADMHPAARKRVRRAALAQSHYAQATKVRVSTRAVGDGMVHVMSEFLHFNAEDEVIMSKTMSLDAAIAYVSALHAISNGFTFGLSEVHNG